MSKKLRVLGPIVHEKYRTVENENGGNSKEKYRYLHIPDFLDREDLEKDIAAGAVQYKSCLDYLNGPESEMVIITCDTEEEGLNAVTYLAAGIGFDDTEEDCCEEDDYVDIDCDNNIPIIGIHELLSYEFAQESVASNNQFALSMNMEQKKVDPYWTEYDGDVCIIDSCMVDDDGNIALMKHDQARGLFSPADEGNEKWHEYFSRFTGTGYRVYYVVVRQGGIRKLFSEKKETPEVDYEQDFPFGMYKTCFDEDFSLCSLILRYTAEMVNIDSKPAQKEDYYTLLFKNHLMDYNYSLEKRFPLRKILRNICFMDNKPSQSIERILRYIKHKYPDRKVLTRELFSETGVLKNVLEKSYEIHKNQSGDVKVDDLVGMEDVKRQFENIIKSIKFCNERKNRGLPGMDYRNIFLLIGAPGTAKTTMANVLGRRMKEEKLLGGTRFGTFSGAQLKGAFVGQTAPRVHQIFEDHDILIIDEAYSLTASDRGGMDTYSQEALAQLAIELEDHGKDRLIFFAGYGGSDVTEQNNKMKEFLDSNPGIKSRINGTIVFPSYNAAQMVDIVKGIAARYGFIFEEGALAPVRAYFESRIHDSNFGNGREARSFVDNCQMTLAERVMDVPAGKQTKRMMQLITKQDVLETLKRLNEANDNQYGRRTVRLGFAPI